MNDREMAQQQQLFRDVLPHLVSLTTRYSIHTLSLPLLWDNVLLSMWTTSGSYVGFGWREVDQEQAQGGDRLASANRTEELAVYQCMVRYLESFLQVMKQCVSQLPADAPLKHIVFYLPSSSLQNTLLHQMDHTNPTVVNVGDGSISSGSSNSTASHPFLPKCQALFREIFN